MPLGVVALWAIFAPRNQWRSLFAWSVSNAHNAEPGGAAFALRQIIAAVAVALALLAVVLTMGNSAAREPVDAPRANEIEETWGTPEPLLVYRSFQTSATPDPTLVDVALVRFLPVNNGPSASMICPPSNPFSGSEPQNSLG